MDANLEKAISDAGRDRVFAIVRAAGWNPSTDVPKFVWEVAVTMARQHDKAHNN